jgi:hypothetical protein
MDKTERFLLQQQSILLPSQSTETTFTGQISNFEESIEPKNILELELQKWSRDLKNLQETFTSSLTIDKSATLILVTSTMEAVLIPVIKVLQEQLNAGVEVE